MEAFILLHFQQGFSYCYGNIITTQCSSSIRSPQKSSTDLQGENEWRREPLPRKSRSRSVTSSSRRQPAFPVSLFTSQYVESLQTTCTHSPLWVRNWHLGLGLYLQLQSSTPHAPAEGNFWGAFSRIPCFSRTEDQELRGKHSTFSRRRDRTFDNYPFERYSFRTIYFYQAAGHINSF